jgi:hypothetical protein
MGLAILSLLLHDSQEPIVLAAICACQENADFGDRFFRILSEIDETNPVLFGSDINHQFGLVF